MNNLETKLDCVERNLEYIESLEEASFYASIDVFNYCTNVYAEMVKRGVEFNLKSENPEMEEFEQERFVGDVLRIVEAQIPASVREKIMHQTKTGG